ncbi:hypothetical protein [Actinokineospora pegani]|uniref:hypothetical protein n=1 Tax=Actinokineospora pegani TaxID=2654637 RepID=UPI0012E9DD72|nr:hypothetical protein [Actinokineospora pegani]
MEAPQVYEADLPIEFSQFFLFDHFSDFSTMDLPTGGPDLARTGNGGVGFNAYAQSVRATIRLEVWSHEPPELTSLYTGVFTTPTGRVTLCATTASPDDLTVDLGSPGRYTIRITKAAEPIPGREHRTEAWTLVVHPVAAD